MKRNLRNTLFSRPWLDEREQDLVRLLVRAIKPGRGGRRGGDDPFEILLADRVIMNVLEVRQLEIEVLSLRGRAETSEGVSAKKDVTSAQRDALGKAQERLRKAMKDYEEYQIRAGGAAGVGLADRIKPILKQADGVLKELLDGEPLENDNTAATGK